MGLLVALSAAELLTTWDRGQGRSQVQRALLLLAAAWPDVPRDAFAQLPIGARNARLLALRELTFGSQFVSLATCPHCGERAELSFDAVDLRVPILQSQEDSSELVPPEFNVRVDDREFYFRLPNSSDLLALENQREISTATHALLERCVSKGEGHAGDHPTSSPPNAIEPRFDFLTDELVNAVAEKMADADPQANIDVALTCPHCAHAWRMNFDIVSFFWTEIDAWARRILRDVHTLASAYGWPEADILALSPLRRQIYLEMVSG